MSVDAISQAYQAARSTLPGRAATHHLRERAIAAFCERGFPDRKLETWKYTELAPVASQSFNPVPERPAPPHGELEQLIAETCCSDGPRMVFVDGHHMPELDLATDAAEGVRLLSLTEAWDQLYQHSGAQNRLDDHPLALLNTALVQDGVWIRTEDGATHPQAYELIFVSSGTSGLSPQPRIVIDLAAGASISVLVRFIDAGDSEGWLNIVTQIHQARESRLELLRVQEHRSSRTHTSLTVADLRENAVLRAGSVDLGGRLVRNDTEVRLLESGARTELYGLFLTTDGQHIDNHTLVDHIAPSTLSSEVYRGIAGTRGRGVFNGKVVVRPGAVKIEAHQSSDNLLLGENAEIDTKPELEIYADDVKCSHGATVGELDEDHLYYLRSRGIDEAEARGMLTSAFANAVLTQVVDAAVRERISARVGERLATRHGVEV